LDGTLTIPFASPERYHWWKREQSLAETRAELSRANTTPKKVMPMDPTLKLTIPVPRALRRVDAFVPTIVVDSREQTPLVFTRLRAVTATLTTGDYSLAGAEHLFSVERKTIDDLVACCAGANRKRFEHELERLRSYRFKRLLVIGSEDDLQNGHYRSQITPRSVLATLRTFEVRYELPIVYRADPLAAACLVEDWIWRFAREMTKNILAVIRGAGSGVPLRESVRVSIGRVPEAVRNQ
jgi:ERCC4-type nuclease